jgi:hypothetical protein
MSFILDGNGVLQSTDFIMKNYASYTVDTSGNVTPSDDVNTTMEFTSAETVGTREQDTSIDFAQYFFTSWTASVSKGDTAVSDLTTLERGTSYSISLASATEPNASIKYDNPTITVKSGDSTGISAEFSQ